jgi:hypothetical protein
LWTTTLLLLLLLLQKWVQVTKKSSEDARETVPESGRNGEERYEPSTVRMGASGLASRPDPVTPA